VVVLAETLLVLVLAVAVLVGETEFRLFQVKTTQ
jgi:hypothetical protein